VNTRAVPHLGGRLLRSAIDALASALDSSAADFGAMTARLDAGKQSVASDWKWPSWKSMHDGHKQTNVKVSFEAARGNG